MKRATDQITANRNPGLQKNTMGHLAHKLMCIIALSVFLPFSVSAGIICVIGVSFCILPGTRDKIFANGSSVLLLMFILLTSAVALYYGNYTGLLRGGTFAMMLVVAVVARALATKKFFEQMLNCFIISGVLSTVGCIIERFIHIDDPTYRCKVFFTNPNFFGTAITLVILICAYKAVTRSKFLALYYTAAIFMAISIYLCGSMALWLVIFIGIFLLLVLNHEYRLLGIFITIVAAAGVVIILIPGLVPRLGEISATTDNRVSIWSFAIEQIKETPVFGRGFFSYKFLYGQMAATRPELYKAALSHNLILESLLSFGIVGTLLIGAYFATFFKTIFKCHDELKRRGHSYVVTTFIAALGIAVACYGMIDTTVVWVQTGMIILMVFSGIGVDERELRHIYSAERAERLRSGNTIQE